MFIATLFTIVRTWKQSKCPPTEEWIKKTWYIYTIKEYSVIERNEIVPFFIFFIFIFSPHPIGFPKSPSENTL